MDGLNRRVVVMRLYGQRLLKNASKRATKQSVETRDAILWDVLKSDRVCRCKIQGSNELVIARFPQNWATVPSWCRPGQAVRIVHRGGIRGYIEIAAYGRAIPTPVSGNVSPDIPMPEDAILTGCAIKAIPQNPRMMAWVSIGTVRFSGAIHIVPAVSIANGGSLIRADMGLVFGQVAGIFEISTPTDNKYRIDAISIGTDLVVAITTGSEFTEEAYYPTIPTGNLLIGYLLVRSVQTEITADDIALVWSAPTASKLSASAFEKEGSWVIDVSVLDQWNNAILTNGGWSISAEVEEGEGTLDAEVKNSNIGNTCSFTYLPGAEDISAFIHFELSQGEVALDTYLSISL